MKNENQKEKRLQFYVEQRESETLMEEYEVSGFGSLSSYLRKKIIEMEIIIPYPKTLLNMMDSKDQQ
jgi:hypothetical protein